MGGHDERHSRIEAALLRIHANMLETVEQAKVEALDLWIEGLKGQVDLLAADPRVRRAAWELVEIGRGRTPAAATEAWKRAPARQRLLRLAQVFATSTHSTGIAVADDRGAVVFSIVEEETGLSLTAEGRRHLTKALGGRTVFIRPYRIGDLTGDYNTGSMYTWVVSPLRGATGEIAAVVASTQRAYGPSSLSRVLAAGEHSSTLESYAFDGDGLILSESRFTEELREVGLAPPLEHTSRAWDAGTQLNVHLRDPGETCSGATSPRRKRRRVL